MKTKTAWLSRRYPSRGRVWLDGVDIQSNEPDAAALVELEVLVDGERAGSTGALQIGAQNAKTSIPLHKPTDVYLPAGWRHVTVRPIMKTPSRYLYHPPTACDVATPETWRSGTARSTTLSFTSPTCVRETRCTPTGA